MDLLISTRSTAINPVRGTNSTTAGVAIANPADKLTIPSGDGVIQFGDYGTKGPNGLQLIPYGVGSDTNTFLMSVFAWDIIPGVQGTSVDSWTAWLLAAFTCTLTTLTGAAGGRLGTSNRYCDTIALTEGNANVSNEIISPEGDVKASIILDGKGARFIEILFAMNSSSTSANCLYREL